MRWQPFNALRRTGQEIQVRWSPTTQFAMGEAADLPVGVRVRGTLGEIRLVEAERFVILTRVAASSNRDRGSLVSPRRNPTPALLADVKARRTSEGPAEYPASRWADCPCTLTARTPIY